MTVVPTRRPRIVWPRCLRCRGALSDTIDEYGAAPCPRCGAGSPWLEQGADPCRALSRD